jgi:hypothetical protein
MSSSKGHGVEGEIDSIPSALAPTRALRQAHDVLSGSLPVEAETPPSAMPSGPSTSTSAQPN